MLWLLKENNHPNWLCIFGNKTECNTTRFPTSLWDSARLNFRKTGNCRHRSKIFKSSDIRLAHFCGIILKISFISLNSLWAFALPSLMYYTSAAGFTLLCSRRFCQRNTASALNDRCHFDHLFSQRNEEARLTVPVGFIPHLFYNGVEPKFMFDTHTHTRKSYNFKSMFSHKFRPEIYSNLL